MNKNYAVITTINKPTKAIEKLYEHFGSNLIVVGDKKTPTDWEYKDVEFFPVGSYFGLANYLPYNHYSRKNIGYLAAIKNKAGLIYDTDDDNIPNKIWQVRTNQVNANESCGSGWTNAYSFFSSEIIWPRGFSLRSSKSSYMIDVESKTFATSIQQGLSDGEADVDAIYRMIFKKKIKFSGWGSVYLTPKCWCPFNSQSTWFFPKAYALMYLPVTVSFRMTDIWRSFIAQRCLWEIGEGVTFHSPSEVFQDRNEHDLLKDFEDEIPGYLNNDKIVEILSELKLKSGQENMCENLLTCYQELSRNNIISILEIPSVVAWIKDYEKFA